METEGDREQPLVLLIEDLERVVAQEGLPPTLRTRATIGLETMRELLDAVRAGNDLLIEEIVLGTIKEDGSRQADGIKQILPYWARGTKILTDLSGIVVVDEKQDPVEVTVHWERLPTNRRREAASLASELVDAYQGRPKGGRPRKRRKASSSNPGDPDTSAPLG